MAPPTANAAAEPVRPTYELAVALLSESSDAPVFGVADSHLYELSPEDLTARLTELRKLGVTDLRVGVPWVYVEAQKGVYDWSKMDALVQTASGMGFNITAAVTATPAWAGVILAGAPNPETYATFAGTVAARYGSHISNYEVWNEPNGVIFYAPVNATSYTRMLQAAYTAIKAANPEAVVLAGALGATGDLNGVSVTPQRFLAEMYAAGAAGYFDALSYHPYNFTLPFSGGGSVYNAPLDQVRKLYELMVANGDGDKQIWATEYGTPTTPGWGVTQKEQAALLRDFLTTWSRLPYAGPAFVYTSKDVQTGILNHEFNFGLFTSNGKPKLAAQVLAELIAASLVGELPDYTAPRMSVARDAYLQVASIVFGIANQAMMLPHAAVGLVYSAMPAPLQRAFSAVANAVSAVVATMATAMAPAMEAVFGMLVRIVPQAPSTETAEDATAAPADAADEESGDGVDEESGDGVDEESGDAAVQVSLTDVTADAEPPVTDEDSVEPDVGVASAETAVLDNTTVVDEPATGAEVVDEGSTTAPTPAVDARVAGEEPETDAETVATETSTQDEESGDGGESADSEQSDVSTTDRPKHDADVAADAPDRSTPRSAVERDADDSRPDRRERDADSGSSSKSSDKRGTGGDSGAGE